MESTYVYTNGESSKAVLSKFKEIAPDVRFVLLLRLDDCFFYEIKYDFEHYEQVARLYYTDEIHFNRSRQKGLAEFKTYHHYRHKKEMEGEEVE